MQVQTCPAVPVFRPGNSPWLSALWPRLPARVRAVTMPEAILAISVGAILIVGATTAALSVIDRIQANARVQEVVAIVENVWARYENAAEYTGIDPPSIAGSLPERMTNDDKDEIYLGGGQLPVGLAIGASTGGPQFAGASSTRQFYLVVGNQDFPVKSLNTCERIIARWDDQDSRFFGFQIAPAAAAINTPPVAAAATNLTVRKAGSGLTATFPAAAISPSVYGANTYYLSSVRSQHIRHACDVLTGINSGARLILAFS